VLLQPSQNRNPAQDTRHHAALMGRVGAGCDSLRVMHALCLPASPACLLHVTFTPLQNTHIYKRLSTCANTRGKMLPVARSRTPAAAAAFSAAACSLSRCHQAHAACLHGRCSTPLHTLPRCISTEKLFLKYAAWSAVTVPLQPPELPTSTHTTACQLYSARFLHQKKRRHTKAATRLT
jgi:hypothetical protein